MFEAAYLCPMIKLGDYNELTILRSTSVGLFLGDDDVDDLLLPTKYVPESYEIGERIKVFCYLDHEERPVATTLEPFIKRNDFGYLRVAEVNQIGAFVDWGLEKHLLVPYKQQREKLKEGDWELVYCYLDDKSFRLVGSTRLDQFLDNSQLDLEEGQEVSLLFYRHTGLGWEVIVNRKYKGLVYSDDIFEAVKSGDARPGFVKQIREDQKLDIGLTPTGGKRRVDAAGKIHELLVEHDGYLPLHDKSSPDEIRNLLQMSKKTFKKAVGTLYREKKIELEEKGIRLR